MHKHFNGAMLRVLVSFALVWSFTGCVTVGKLTGLDVHDNKVIATASATVKGTISGGSAASTAITKDDLKDALQDAVASGSQAATTTIIVQQPTQQVASFKAIGPQVWTGDMFVKTATDSFIIKGAEPLAFAATADILVVAASVSNEVRGFKLTETASGDTLIQEWAEVLPFAHGASFSSAQFDSNLNPGLETRDMIEWNEASKSFAVSKDGQMVALSFSITWAPFGHTKDEASNRFALFGEDAVFAFKDGKKWWYTMAPVADVMANLERIRWPITPVAEGLGEPRYLKKVGTWLYTHSWDEDLKKFVLWRVDKKELKRQLN